MTITFSCPHCGNLCAFDAQHAGRCARCTTCQKRFIIPKDPRQNVEKVDEEVAEIGDGPFSGFYRSVLCQSWRAFFKPSAAAPLLFLALVVALKFFFGHPANKIYIAMRMPVFVGWPITIITWATLLWYYMRITYKTGFGEESLPVIRIGLLPVFIVEVLQAAYSIAMMFVVVEGPFLVAMIILKTRGVESPTPYYLLGAIGFFAVPMAFMIFAVGHDPFAVLRIDQIASAIVKALLPYLVVLAFCFAALAIQFLIVQYARKAAWHQPKSWAWLLCNVLSAYFGIIVARVAGLFYKHYGCFLPC